jgi:hypothetical protein
MTNRTTNVMRKVLPVVIVLLLGLTAFLYFRTGEFYFPSVVVALGCLVIFLVTKPGKSPGRD